MSGLIILHEDNHCLAVAKPAPLLTQGVPPGIPTLESLVKSYLRERYQKKGGVYLGIPHRLDRPVSGVVLFARSTKAARRLAEQFRTHEVKKVYWGAVAGQVQPGQGEWRDWLQKLAEEARSERVDESAPHARLAELKYRVLGGCVEGSLLQFEPMTGRMHQIRIQCSSRGHPIHGDVLYGSQTQFGPEVALPRERIIALHGRSLTFLHPIRYEPITLTAPLPPAWNELGIDESAICEMDKPNTTQQ